MCSTQHKSQIMFKRFDLEFQTLKKDNKPPKCRFEAAELNRNKLNWSEFVFFYIPQHNRKAVQVPWHHHWWQADLWATSSDLISACSFTGSYAILMLTFAFVSWYGSQTADWTTYTVYTRLGRWRRGSQSWPDTNSCFTILPSDCRFGLSTCRTNRHKNSFVPAAICLFNSEMWLMYLLYHFPVVCYLHFGDNLDLTWSQDVLCLITIYTFPPPPYEYRHQMTSQPSVFQFFLLQLFGYLIKEQRC